MEEVSDGVVDFMKGLPALITTFAGLGPWGWVIGGVFALLIGIGGWLLVRWIKKQEVERSNRQTDQNREDNTSTLPEDQSSWERGNQTALERLRERLKKLTGKG